MALLGSLTRERNPQSALREEQDGEVLGKISILRLFKISPQLVVMLKPMYSILKNPDFKFGFPLLGHQRTKKQKTKKTAGSLLDYHNSPVHDYGSLIPKVGDFFIRNIYVMRW